MKILVDTNVILDVLCNRPEFVEASSKVWKYCEVDQIEGVYFCIICSEHRVYSPQGTDSTENGTAHSADHDDL